ncbi:lytic polysaccharide monooxygenase [Streptomyces sp. NPDC053780]|uniref:lytic polysaccharide monooxygenase auxiliary activity family 9 protein n=1 Tax=unclassified Streptomyces TaxID=2593676 RepID=UPI000F74857D|nr:lytic polysaccharide monooxygenase auxiliary activity family 9 protein [Streptomyces sp. WAC 04229]RSN60079.1 cellulose-binding protein [Streptomyces sp. WAC 04229]
MTCHDHGNPVKPVSPVKRARRTTTLALGALTAVLLTLIPWSGTAFAHGSVVDPASRNYGCWDRWGDDFQNPAMAQEDPMCWQAWQDDPNAMWNWNGLYRNGSAGDFRAVVPDGQLCSGGRTESGRYDSLDTVGAWRTTDVADDFTVKLHDQAGHGADYFLVYVTRQGFDPATQALTWGDLQQVARTGSYAPGQNYEIPVSTSGLSGRHVVYTIWQASHMDQTYFLCSDVDFG